MLRLKFGGKREMENDNHATAPAPHWSCNRSMPSPRKAQDGRAKHPEKPQGTNPHALCRHRGNAGPSHAPLHHRPTQSRGPANVPQGAGPAPRKERRPAPDVKHAGTALEPPGSLRDGRGA